jgi:uncharacterized protein YprB with RNaseH-like and TPR domain
MNKKEKKMENTIKHTVVVRNKNLDNKAVARIRTFDIYSLAEKAAEELNEYKDNDIYFFDVETEGGEE